MRVAVDADRLDPNDLVLQDEQLASYGSYIHGVPRTFVGGTDVKKKRALIRQDTLDLHKSLFEPSEIFILWPGVIVGAITDTRVVW
jgi:hypothetical protein